MILFVIYLLVCYTILVIHTVKNSMMHNKSLVKKVVYIISSLLTPIVAPIALLVTIFVLIVGMLLEQLSNIDKLFI